MKAFSKQAMMNTIAAEVGETVIESCVVGRVGFLKDYLVGEIANLTGEIGSVFGIGGAAVGGIIGGNILGLADDPQGAFTGEPSQANTFPDKMLMTLTNKTLGLFEYDFGVFRNLLGDMLLLIDRESISEFKIGPAQAHLIGARNISISLSSGLNFEIQTAAAYMSKARRIEDAFKDT